MKLYFHFMKKRFPIAQNADDALVTAAVAIPGSLPSMTVAQCLQLVRCAALRRFNINMDSNGDVCMLGNKRAISGSTLVSAFIDSDDFFVLPANRQDGLNTSVVIYNHAVSKASDAIKDHKIHNAENFLGDGLVHDCKSFILEAKNHEENRREDLALALYQQVLCLRLDDQQALYGCAKIYWHACRYDQAVQLFSKLCNFDPMNNSFLLYYARALTAAGKSADAVSYLSSSLDDSKFSRRLLSSKNVKFKMHCALAHALETVNQKEAAFDLYLNCCRESDKKFIDAAIGYVRIGYALGKCSLHDVFMVLLAAVVKRGDDSDVKLLFSAMMKKPGAFECLIGQLGVGVQNPTVLCTVAKFLRDIGCLEQSLRLIYMAMKISPEDVGNALLMMHIQENLLWYSKALEDSIEFLLSKPEMRRIRNYDLSSLPKLIMDDVSCCRASSNDYPLPVGIEEVSHCNLDADELRLLAIYLTLVKIAFVFGCVRCLPVVVQLLQPLCRHQKLGETLIRNENAYFICISQILTSCPPLVKSMGPYVYLVGDSHVLPAAWRSVTMDGLAYQIFPMLVTGLKIWHLRRESLFYPKRNFEMALQLIPPGSNVVFILGEIDCREGVLRSVQKCCYDTMEQCLLRLVQIYISVLSDLHDKLNLKIFVHPVPPVLEESRSTIFAFNRMLKKKVRKQRTLKWLDFAEELLAPDGSLLDAYKFDGVHLHPSYVDLLEKHLRKS